MNKSKNIEKAQLNKTRLDKASNITPEATSSKGAKEFKYKTDRIERALSIVALAFFFISIIYDKSIPVMVGFFLFATVIILYYIIWFRKKPAYVKISGEDVTVSQGFFFKPFLFHKSMIKEVKSHNRIIVIDLTTNNKVSSLKLYKFLLSDSDSSEIYSSLSTKK